MICIKISDCTQLETEAIMQNKYQQKYTEIFQQIGDHAKLVLATSLNNKVSARTMSFVILEGSLYFQTDKEMRKYQDIQMLHYASPIFSLKEFVRKSDDLSSMRTFADCFNNIFHRPLKPIASFQMKGYL